MNILRILLVIWGLSIGSAAQAQGILMRIANNHMRNLNYQAAIDAYKKVLEKEENGQAKVNIAEAYRKLSDTHNAENWYAEVVKMTNIKEEQYLYYAQMLQRNGKCEQAKKWFKRYAEAAPDDTRGQYLARSCDYVEELMTRNAKQYEIQRLWFNSPNDDFSPFYYRDGIVFVSERKVDKYVKRSSSWSDKPFLKLFFVQMLSSNIDNPNAASCDFIYGKPSLFSPQLGTRFHEASAVFSSDETEVFFTRSTTNEELGAGTSSVYRLQLYQSERVGGAWSKPQSLSFNSRTYSCAHPALSKDGRYLFFSADIPGGYGGMDLYVVERVGKRWGQPINLGDQINTEGNEVFPTIDPSGRLYFSSDGQIGLGGLDIYYTEKLGKELWSTPENLGYPINTIADDFGMVFDIDGTCGYFSSNRAGGAGGDDIYTFTKQSASITVKVVNAETKAPIGNILVEENCNNNAFVTNADGLVVFDLARSSCCEFKADAESGNFYSNQINKCLDDLKAVDANTITIELKPRLNFGLKGVIFDQLTGLPLSEAKVTLQNDCGDTTIASTVTTADGRFQFPIRSNCCYSIQADHAEYYSSTQEGHCTRGLRSSKMLSTKFYLQRK